MTDEEKARFIECGDDRFEIIKRAREHIAIGWLKNEVHHLEKENEQLKAQIKKMKCCENCNRYRKAKCTEDNMFYSRTTRQCKEWEQAE